MAKRTPKHRRRVKAVAGKAGSSVKRRAPASPRTTRALGQERMDPQLVAARAQASERLLRVISRLQTLFIDEAQPAVLFAELLHELLLLTKSEYGFIGEVARTAEGQPFLRTQAITDIAWNKATKALMAEQAPTLEFRNLKTLFGHVMTTGKPVIANDPAHDPRAGGLPPGHPPMHAFLGVPLYRGEQLTGMVGIANRPGGYDEALVAYLEPFLATCAQLLEGYRHRRLRAEAEAALRESEERWQLAVRGGNDGIWDWNIATGRAFFSARWKQMRGFEEDELTDSITEWRSRIHLDDLDRVRQACEAYLTQRAPEFREEYRVKRKDGSYMWVLDRGVARWDDQGVAVRMAGSELDITERKQAEQALLEAHTAVELAIEGISKLDDEGRYLFVNAQYAALLGYRPDELIGQSWEITVHPDDRIAVLEYFSQMLATGKAEAEIRGVRKDGSLIHKHVVIVKPDTLQGKMSGHYCFARDISERKRHEAFLSAEKQALELVAQGAGLSEVLTFICRTIEAHTAPMLTSIMLVTEDGQHLCCVAAPSLPEDYNRAVDGIPIGPTIGSCGSAAYFQKPAIVSDIATHPLWEHYAPMAMAHGLQACWSQPIISSSGDLLGTFAAYYREPRSPQPTELNIVERASHMAALAIEHLKVTEALRESEARFQAFMTHSPAVSFIKDAAGRHLYINPTFERLFGVSLREIHGKTLEGRLPPEVVAQLQINDEKVLSSGQPIEVEETVPTPDGRSQHWLVLKFPLISSSGERLLGGKAIDITARKQAEDALRESEERFRVLADTAPVLIWLSGLDKSVIYFNRGWVEYTGRTMEQELGGGWVEGVHPDDVGCCWATYSEAFDRRESFEVEYRLRKADGQYGWLHETGAPRFLPSGTFAGYHGACIDITARKRAEEEQLRTRTLLTNVINTTPDLVFVKDRDLRTILCNQVFAQAQGKDPTELIGHTDIENGWDPELVHGNPDKGIRGFEQDDREALSGKTVHNTSDPANINGAIRIFDTFKVPLRDEQGNITGILGIARDVTARKWMEDALNALVRGTGAVTGEAFFPIFVRELAQALQVKCAAVIDVRKDLRDWAMVRAMWIGDDWVTPFEATLSGTPCEVVVQQGSVCYPTAVRDRFPNAPMLASLKGESYLGHLLVNVSGDPMGLIFVADEKPVTDPTQAMAILQVFAARAAAELERLKADEALRASQERFELAVRATNDGIWDWNIITGEVYWSDRTFELLGLQPGEIVLSYETWQAMLHPDDATKMHQAVLRHLEMHEPFDIELRVKMNDGSYRWFQDQGGAVWDPSGKPLRMVGSISDITDRKAAEDALRVAHADLEQRVIERTTALRQSEQRYAGLVNSADGIILEVDGETYQITFVSQQAERILGYPVEEWLNDPMFWINHLHPDDLRWAPTYCQDMTKQGLNHEFEYRMFASDGRIVWIRDAVSVSRDDAGHLRLSCILMDVTKHKDMVDRLGLTQYAVDQASDQIFVIGPDGYFRDVNESACRRLGYRKDELLTMSVMDIDPDFPVGVWDSFWKEFTKVKRMQLETRHRNKSGEIYSVEVVANYLYHDGQELDYAIVRDITERKQSEAALLESEERFSKAFNESAIGMAIVATDGRWLQVNQALCEIVGYSKAELEVTTFQAITHPDDLEGDFHLLQQVLSGELRTYQLEKRYLHKNGSVVWILLNVSLVRNADGTPKHFISQIQDISARKQLQEQRARYTEDLEQQVAERTTKIAKLEAQRAQTEKLVTIGQLAAGVAHEINNPIAGIKNAFRVVKDDLPSGFPRANFISMIEREIDRVAAVVQQLYQLSPGRSQQSVSVDLTTIISDLSVLVASQLKQRRLTMQVEHSGPFGPIVAPQGALQQVLLNLIRNAIEVSPADGVITIRLSAGVSERCISVIDHGAGIAPEVLPKIFEPFFTTKVGGSLKGMGLGLSISHSLIQAMGGRIDVKTGLGLGSTFTITIPAQGLSESAALPGQQEEVSQYGS